MCRLTSTGTLATTGCILFLLGISIPILSPLIENSIINKKLEIKEDNEGYELWRKPPPVKNSFFFYNISNPEKFLLGDKPILNQVGQYVYIEQRENVNVSWNENGTVSFIPIRRMFFNQELSVGDEKDFIVTLNIPLISAAMQLKDGDINERLALNNLIEALKYTSPFTVRTVGELLWGYRDPLFEIGKAKMSDEASFVPEHQLFGLFSEVNGTQSGGRFTVFTGRDSIQNIGRIDNHNGKTALHCWKGEKCNVFNGSSAGTTFPPELRKDTKLSLYNPEFCRTLPLEFYKEVAHNGLKAFRFGPPKNLFDTAAQNPDNECFCPANSTGSECSSIQGLFSIAPCKFGAPLAISWPHFLFGDPKLLEDVEGLNPDPEKHGFFIDFFPRVTVPMQVKVRTQVNIMLQKIDDFKLLAGIRTLAYPIFWMEISMDALPADAVGVLRKVSYLPGIWIGISCVLIGAGALLLGVAARSSYEEFATETQYLS